MEARRGSFGVTYTGRKYWPQDPRPEDVSIYDIAHHLSLLCRYTGAAKKFYSVAEHSVWVSCLVPPEHAFVALMHDAAEAYVNDLARPVKAALGSAYADLEAVNWRAIAMAFDLPMTLPDCVLEADERIYANEKQALFGLTPPEWGAGIEPYPDITILAVPSERAERMFLRAFAQLQRQRQAV